MAAASEEPKALQDTLLTGRAVAGASARNRRQIAFMKNRRPRVRPPVLSLMLALAAAGLAQAEVKLNPLFSDHAVLQCGAPAPVWGWAGPGEKIQVSFGGQSRTTRADSFGKWIVQLAPFPASAEPRELTVRGATNTVRVQDVLAGEVWLAGGQSNMRSPLFAAHNAAEVVPGAADPQLRLFNVKFKTAAEPQPSVSGQWQASAPETAKDFSAVGYFFARELRRVTDRPVAVISASWGGTPIQTWISLAGLKQNPALERTLAEWDKAVEQYKTVQANPKLVLDYEADLKRWKNEIEPAYSAAAKVYNAAKAAGKAVGEKPQPARPEPQNPDPMGMPSPSRRPQTPTVSFNGMIAPLAPYAMRGVIWYQGEANGSAGLEYRKLFPRLIQDWRAHFGPKLTFLYVQLPGWGADAQPVAESGWPWTREAQLMALSEPHTGMAITIDIGDPNNVHPADKLDVAQRLALLARREAYGEKLAASGPLYRDFAVEGTKIRIRFRETGSGLTAGQAPWRAAGVAPLPTDRLVGFFIAGADRKWVEAEAKIEGESVLVSSPAVSQPAAVRYGWANSPRCNLYNREGLPASPFRTDDWPK